MCGIAGLLRTDGQPVSACELERMTESLRHRGPDGAGAHLDGPLGLGHRRLAIIDLEGGAQPLANEDGTVWVVFNGEIYNFRDLQRELTAKGHTFATRSDTEVLVHAFEEWGEQCVTRLRGMFAFAIWDARARRLFLARDRVGIKPLYWLRQRGLVAFASEMQAFQQLEDFAPTLDVSAVDQYLHFGYIPAPASIYREVRKLPPAHTLTIDLHGQTHGPRRYWELALKADRSLDEHAWRERLDAALDETVRTHLVSDVPFGAFVSGGVDSSTVLACMSRELKEPVQAFCIGHASAEYDERPFAREAAKICGAEFSEEAVLPDALELLPDLVRHFGEPFGDSSAVPAWYAARLARRHVKMVLSGDGGDELFAGYHAYAAILAEHRPAEGAYKQTKHYVANQARRIGLWPKRSTAADAKYARCAVIDAETRRRLWRSEHRAVVDDTRERFDADFMQGPKDDLLGRLQHFDVSHYLAYDNLPKVDVASMFHGLEVRVPLLDHVFLETAVQVPPELKLHGQPPQFKYLLKRSAERFFPREFLDRPKRGFEVPVRDWFAGPRGPELRDSLVGSGSPLRDLFERDALQQVVESAAESRPQAWRAWSLLVLREWMNCTRIPPKPASVNAVAQKAID